MPKPKKTQGSSTPAPLPIDRWELLVLASAAKVDPRTFKNYLTGGPVRSVPMREIVEHTLRTHGYECFVRQAAAVTP